MGLFAPIPTLRPRFSRQLRNGATPANLRPPIKMIRWWWVVLFAFFTALATGGATWWLLSVAGNSASLRVQAIQSGLTVAAGTGGATALLLAGCRLLQCIRREQEHFVGDLIEAPAILKNPASREIYDAPRVIVVQSCDI
jgi:hypothetical protein